MTCMTAPEQTCIVQVILEHEEAFNLRQHRRNETMLKKRILDFIHQLRQRGFRHFIMCCSFFFLRYSERRSRSSSVMASPVLSHSKRV